MFFHNFYRNCWLWISRFTRIDEHENRFVWLISGWQVTFYLRWQEETIFSNFVFLHRYLTNDGIEHLQTYLNLHSEIVPATLKKSARPPSRPMGAPGADRPPRGPPREGERPPWFGDREGYRSSSGFGGEKDGVPGDYRPDFQSGGGRGFGRGGGGFNSRAPSAITE